MDKLNNNCVSGDSDSISISEFSDDGLNCPACSREFINPKLLSCLHSFCIECLDRLLKRGVIICPTCHLLTEVDDPNQLPANIFISSILKSRQFQSGSCEVHRQCSNCEDEELNAVCKECRLFLCAFCTQAHKKQKSTRNHEMVSLEEFITSASDSDIFVSLHCDIHDGEVMKMFCSTCEVVLCRDCVIAEHREHTVKETKEAYHEIKPEIRGLVHRIDGVKKQIETAIETVHKMENNVRETASNQTAKVNHVFEEISRVLIKRKKELIDSILHDEAYKLDVLADQADRLTQDIEAMRHATEFSKDTLERDNPFEVLMTRKFISKHLELLIEEKSNFTLDEGDDMEFGDKNIHRIVQLLAELGEIRMIPRTDTPRVENMLKMVDLSSSECRQTFTVTSVDRRGSPTKTTSVDDISVTVINCIRKDKCLGEILDNKDGTYTVTYQVQLPGQYQVNVMCGRDHLMGSPFNFIFRRY